MWAGALLAMLVVPVGAGKKSKAPAAEQPWPELLLDGGRKVSYQRTLTSERDTRGPKRGFWNKVLDIAIGEPDFRPMMRPYGVAVDSRGRVIVTDPAMSAVHIFDLERDRYKLIERFDRSKDPMTEPQSVAVDSKDNIYVTDSRAGKVFVFDREGKTRHVFGSLKGGEGFFKRPTGIAIDPETRRVYVTDTLRNCVYILDEKGTVIRQFGEAGSDNGQFNNPTEILIRNGLVAVIDVLNFRVQLFDLDGNFKSVIGKTGDPMGGIYRPKGLAMDSEGHIYVVDGEMGLVQVFDTQGRLLYRFGNGTGFGHFLLPAGLFIDRNDRLYLADSYNRRVQVFQYQALNQGARGADQ